MNSNAKIITGVLTGAVVGAILGILFAPDDGAETRRKISKSVSVMGAKAKEKLHIAKNEVADPEKER